MTVMAILQDADLCMRCSGCVVSCKRTWDLKDPTNIADVVPAKNVVGPRQRLAIKSQKRVDMGPYVRFSCWHCPDPPCAKACPLGAIAKEENGAVSVDNGKCNPNVCKTTPGPKPCEFDCQRGGYTKVGIGYNGIAQAKSNKCTLCFGRAGDVDVHNALPTTASTADIAAVPEKAHQPACVYTCPAKAMKWDTRENIIAYLNNPANGYVLADGTKNWLGNGSMFWASSKVQIGRAHV